MRGKNGQKAKCFKGRASYYISIRLWKQTKLEQCAQEDHECALSKWGQFDFMFSINYSSEPHHLTFRWWVDLILSSSIYSLSPLSLFSFPRSSFALFYSLHLSLSVILVSFSPPSQVVIKPAADGAAVVWYLRVSSLTTALRLWTQHTQTAAVEKWFTSSHIRHQRAWLKSAGNRAVYTQMNLFQAYLINTTKTM